MAEIKQLGGFSENKRKDGAYQTGYAVFDKEGVCPTLLANGGGYGIMIIEEEKKIKSQRAEMNRQDKTKQDKTRQDKTMVMRVRTNVKWWCLVIWTILSTTLLRARTEFMTRIIYARQFRLVPEVEYSRKSLKKQNVA